MSATWHNLVPGTYTITLQVLDQYGQASNLVTRTITVVAADLVTDEGGIPAGLSLLARHGQDDFLLEVAKTIEKQLRS